MSDKPAPPTSPVALACMRIAEHFVAIAGELENLDNHVGSSLDSLATLREREQSHVVGAPVLGLRRSREMQAAQSNTTSRKFLSPNEVAAVLGIGLRTLRRLRKDKEARFPVARKFGGALRWNASEVGEWAERQRERA